MSGCSGNCFSCKPGELELMAKESHEFKYDVEKMSHPIVGIMAVTSRCNLACPYCFHEQSNNDMTLETAIQAAEFLIKNSQIRGTKPVISFFGGEPLLKWDDIIVPLVEKYGSRLDWSITTNGTLLDEDKIDFCWKNKIGILLSIDGVKEVQDFQRPAKIGSSFEMLKRNIPYLLLRLPDTTFRATVTKYSIKYLMDTYNMAKNMGFKKISLCPNFYEDFNEQDLVILQDFFDKISIKMMEDIRDIKFPEIIIDNLTKMYRIISITNRTSDLSDPLEKCGQGITGVGISTKGYLHPCQERNCDEEKDNIGNVFNGICVEKHEKALKLRYDAYMKYLHFIDHKLLGSNNFKKVMAEAYCLQRLAEGHGESSSNIIFQRAVHKAASRLYWNYNLTMNPMARHIFEEA